MKIFMRTITNECIRRNDDVDQIQTNNYFKKKMFILGIIKGTRLSKNEHYKDTHN